jgi:hypothetical protein
MASIDKGLLGKYGWWERWQGRAEDLLPALCCFFKEWVKQFKNVLNEGRELFIASLLIK